jgi:hypothetical protein
MDYILPFTPRFLSESSFDFAKTKVKRQIKTLIVSLIIPPCFDEVQGH